MPQKAMHMHATTAHSPSWADSDGALTARAGQAAWGRADLGQVKDEQDWESEAAACGVSEAHARAQLYKDHIVKDELVLGPEILQPPDVMFALRDIHVNSQPSRGAGHRNHTYAKTKESPQTESVQVLSALSPRVCVERPERLASRDDNDSDLGNEMNRSAPIDTEEKTNVCDICKKEFDLKSQLLEHAMIHIHRGAEGSQISEAHARAQLYKDHIVKDELVLGPEILQPPDVMFALRDIHVNSQPSRGAGHRDHTYAKTKESPQTEMLVKQEPEHMLSDAGARLRGTSAGLYAHHAGQEELVLGPEAVQPAGAVLTSVQVLSALSPRACVERPERLASRDDNDSDLENEMNRSAPIDTEEKTNVCDICKKEFDLKSQLLEHAMIHVHRGAEGSQISEAHARAQLYKDHIVKDELVLGPEILQPPDVMFALRDIHVNSRPSRGAGHRDHTYAKTKESPQTEMLVKQESEHMWSDAGARLRGTSAGLYAHHAGQEELVLGPEAVQPAGAVLTSVQVLSALSPRACVEQPERLASHDDNDSDLGNEMNRSRPIDTEEKTNVCDICKKGFDLKSQLLNHAMIHVHRGAEGAQISVASNAESRASQCAPRDCVVRLERIAGHTSLHSNVEPNSTHEHTYTCDTCDKSFTLKTRLVEHIMNHIHQNAEGEESRRADSTESRASQCALRDCVVRLERIAGHTSLHSAVEPNSTHEHTYTCDTCDKSFTLKTRLVEHIMNHIHQNAEGEESRRADSMVWPDGALFCARSLSSRARAQLAMTCAVRLERLCGGEARDDRRATHEVEVHTDSVKAEAYTCDTCGKQFPRKPSLIRHVQRHTRTASSSKKVSRKSIITQRVFTHDAKKAYTCEICDKAFTVKRYLMTHIRSIHGGIKPYSCDMCDKRFSLKGNFNKHIRIHTGHKPYTCHICNKGFNHRQNFNRHVRIHTGQKPYSCHTCNKRFLRKDQLNVHIRIHTGQKPYRCDACKKRFANKDNLNNHVRRHTGQKPYICDTCNKRFTERGLLMRHVRIHTGQKPYNCHICNKPFTRKHDMNRHVGIHTGQKPYTCDVCNKQFTEKGHLNKHLKIHTGQNK